MTRRVPGSDAESATIPSVEIGSFVITSPDESQFIGSASGVFFANTVFRAFARSTSAASHAPGQPGGPNPPGPGSVLDCLGTGDAVREPEGADDFALDPGSARTARESPATKSYGVVAPGLGAAPPLPVARHLLMQYFQNWHPFFPFLHGPTFLAQVNAFYGQDAGLGGPRPSPGASPDTAGAHLSPRGRLCRAITFQCVFNIAASGQGQSALEPASRIQSTSALTALLGAVSNDHNTATLQALLAAELLLMVNMSLRAASTITGAITRIIYHAGLHRCPSRYISLSPETRDMRRRIFWSAYVLDHCVSQLLGHPCGFQDTHVDTCLPGLDELHRPVQAQSAPSKSAMTPQDEVRAHLPRDHPDQISAADRLDSEGHDDTESSGPAIPDDAGLGPKLPEPTKEPREFVLGYFGTYSRLAGECIDLLHKSIHSRSVTRQKIHDISYKVQTWWNGLPLAFQDVSEAQAAGIGNTYVVFFSILYNHLLIMIHRPFLSLPTHSADFQSNLQAAIGASHDILQKLKTQEDHAFLMAWPVTLSATWMSGLIIAFAGLLGNYPLEKAKLELSVCLRQLGAMGTRWVSAQHCEKALGNLLVHLNKPEKERLPPPLSAFPQPAETPGTESSAQVGNESRSTKRKRPQDQPVASFPERTAVFDPGLNQQPNFPMPVLQWRGPDFGFDASQGGSDDMTQTLFGGEFEDPSSGGFFSGAGWDAFIEGLGSDGQFNL